MVSSLVKAFLSNTTPMIGSARAAIPILAGINRSMVDTTDELMDFFIFPISPLAPYSAIVGNRAVVIEIVMIPVIIVSIVFE